MNWLDILIMLAIAVSIIFWLTKGLVHGMVSFLGLIAMVLITGKLYLPLASKLPFITNTGAAEVTSFGVIIAACIAGVGWLNSTLSKFASIIKAVWLDRLLGGILGLLIGVVGCGVALALYTKYYGADQVSGSFLAKIFLDKFPVVLSLLPSSFDSVKKYFQ